MDDVFQTVVLVGLILCLIILRYKDKQSTESTHGNIRYSYDKKARMGYIYLNGRDGPNTQGVRTEEIAPGVFADYEISTGVLLGLEIFDTRSK